MIRSSAVTEWSVMIRFHDDHDRSWHIVTDHDHQGVDRKEIINMFADASQCPKLHMRPKMFIFQVKRKILTKKFFEVLE